MTAKKKGLGKGLGALLNASEIQLAKEAEAVYELDINDISPQAGQPRKIFEPEALQELADSIAQEGVLQPIIVRKIADRNYSIIAGERRWRASRLAGMTTIPAIIRDVDEVTQVRQALVENIQREDLNPLEEAQAYQILMDRYDMTQEALAGSLAKSRSAIANTLRLNNLAPDLQDLLAQGKLSEGQARALLALKDQSKQVAAGQYVVEKGLNVRQTEAYVRLLNADRSAKSKSPKDLQYALSVKSVEDKISKHLGVKVKLKDRAGKGKIEIPYKNLDELDRLIELLAE
ncbi:MAG: ParB/RepB/Spo0J family partition protein [Eubacteriales bacterium]|nr:ParB/RepB/Spo0J family partition protein [Clostridiales bacterium]MDY5836662.1 ParB/RepB/Spo0J family partition protein [Eubacteriales bacterium]